MTYHFDKQKVQHFNNTTVQQRSEDWHKCRTGKITASRVHKLMKVNVAYHTYFFSLLCERLTGETTPTPVTEAMQWGIDHEPEAIQQYVNKTGNIVNTCGFFDHPTIPMCGASPDGLVGDDGLVEIKCPKTSTHLEYITKQKVPYEYLMQIHLQLACTERKWCDFVSYDPRLHKCGGVSMWIHRIQRDNELIATMETAINTMNSKINEWMNTHGVICFE